ncbi:hypothetical protein [Azospirillum sp.]|uniref:hypothetical protein n=1 Tax=Azospirillum sp. TaxID=34012 RepID=UPI002D39C0BE|nr:hypothetical protein [Azospirillum sp.]HYD63879.1 hypothetical protein [Azospirillum sp.]
MRYLQIVTLEQAALSWLYGGHDGLDARSAAEQHAAIAESGLLIGRDLAEPMRDHGWDAALVVANARQHQERWAREQGCADLLTAPDWMTRVLAAQIERMAPDVLHVIDQDLFASRLPSLTAWRPRLVVGGPSPAAEPRAHGFDVLAPWPGTGELSGLLPFSDGQDPPAAAMADGLWDIVYAGTLTTESEGVLRCLQAVAESPAVLDGRLRAAFFVDVEPGLRVPDPVARHIRPRLWGWRLQWQVRSARVMLHADRPGIAAAAELLNRTACGAAVVLAADFGRSPLCQLSFQGLPAVAATPADAAATLIRLAERHVDEDGADCAGVRARHDRQARAQQLDRLLRRRLGQAAPALSAPTVPGGAGASPVARMARLWRQGQRAELAALAGAAAAAGGADAVWYRRVQADVLEAEGQAADAATIRRTLMDDPRMPGALRLDLASALHRDGEAEQLLAAALESNPLGSADQIRSAALLRRDTGREWLVVLGIDGDDPGGAGRLVARLRETLPALVPNVQFYRARDLGDAVVDQVLDRQARTDAEILLIHPQCLGFGRTNSLILGARRPVLLYLLDSSFFCVRSYNHRPGMFSPCTECAGGSFDRQMALGCQPFPIADPAAMAYTKLLLMQARAGRVRPFAQNRAQAALARRHFGPQVPVPVVGMWTADLELLFPGGALPPVAAEPGTGPVVFHAWHLDPKGMSWTVEVARHCPEVEFLFPFVAGMIGQEPPPNCRFESITWETGLEERVRTARLTLVPSMWSAPIEGSLVKSLICSPAVGVVDAETTFSSEIPDDVLLKLPVDPRAAADLLRARLAADWRPDPQALTGWLAEFVRTNRAMTDNLHGAVVRTADSAT